MIKFLELLNKALFYNKIRLCCFISILIFVACSREKNVTVLSSTQNLQKEIESQLPLFLTEDSIPLIDSIPLTCYQHFKNNYTNQLVWFTQSKFNNQGDSLWQLIQTCNYYGLISEQYHLSDIKQHLDSVHRHKDIINVTSLIKADLLLSDAYYLLGAHLNKGRFYTDSLLLLTNFAKLDTGWDSILKAGYDQKKIKAALDSLEPKLPQYKLLKKELAIILNNKTTYPFDSIPFVTEKDSIKLNSLIIKNLIKQGLYDTLNSYNDSIRLVKALNLFQKKWFIQPDGKIGKYTKQALTYNREKIIKQISMAMERWRWENPKFPERYAFINIPAFYLTVYEKDTIVMQSAVVCGKPDHQTPILKSKIDHMLIYPYWNVPYSIASKEILPAVQKDTSYIRKKNFEVLGKGNVLLDYTKLPWKKYKEDYLPVKFRQRIGDENSLGIVKFNFNNPYGVYLHDTNSKRYFKTSSRAQSHGCIRLENYSQFADFLIRDDSLHYTHDSLQLYFTKQEQRKIRLKKYLPIYVRYYTAEVTETGFKLYLDVYKKDEEMMNLIYQK